MLTEGNNLPIYERKKLTRSFILKIASMDMLCNTYNLFVHEEAVNRTRLWEMHTGCARLEPVSMDCGPKASSWHHVIYSRPITIKRSVSNVTSSNFRG